MIDWYNYYSTRAQVFIMSDLIKLINPKTKRVIIKDGAAYKKLILSGVKESEFLPYSPSAKPEKKIRTKKNKSETTIGDINWDTAMEKLSISDRKELEVKVADFIKNSLTKNIEIESKEEESKE